MKNKLKYNGVIEAHCPECGYVNHFDPRLLEIENNLPVLVCCDCDDGAGCGKYFVIFARLSCITDVFRVMTQS